jgi:hypothetical protein
MRIEAQRIAESGRERCTILLTWRAPGKKAAVISKRNSLN